MKEKNQQVQIHHIKAHEGVENLFQRGNDMADKIAKEYMTRAEEMIRAWLKKHEVEKLSRTGRHSKCPAS